MSAAALLADEVVVAPFTDINKWLVGGTVFVVFLILLFVVSRFNHYR